MEPCTCIMNNDGITVLDPTCPFHTDAYFDDNAPDPDDVCFVCGGDPDFVDCPNDCTA